MRSSLLALLCISFSLGAMAQTSILLSYNRDFSGRFGVGLTLNEQAWDNWGIHMNVNVLFNGDIPDYVVSRVYLNFLEESGDSYVRYARQEGSYTWGFRCGPTYRIHGGHHAQTSLGFQFQPQYAYYSTELGLLATELGLNYYGSSSIGYLFLHRIFSFGLTYTESWTSDADFFSMGVGVTF
ncbi:MAG: hypothetical protein HWD92_12465 [Flavobacteriia bacterium]|nr:hypothetical protein [Flavobacteriia bacterium]